MMKDFIQDYCNSCQDNVTEKVMKLSSWTHKDKWKFSVNEYIEGVSVWLSTKWRRKDSGFFAELTWPDFCWRQAKVIRY